MQVLLVIAAITFALGSILNTPSVESSIARQQDVWSSEHFRNDDVPCGVPAVPAQFAVNKGLTAENAYLLMAANHLAYRFWPGRRERILRQWGFSNFGFFDNSQTSTNGLWAEHKDFVLLVFRGTQEPTDFLTDANVTLDPAPVEWNVEGRIHRGFLSAAQSVEAEVLRTASFAQKRQKPFILSGHSLGGAIALLSAVSLELKNTPIQDVWTFGAPKVGDTLATRAMRDILKRKLHQLNQAADPIPLLPFTSDEQPALKQLAQNYGKYLPLFGKLAAHAAYDTAAAAEPQQHLVTRKSFVDVAYGFWKHLPRAYVCDLGNRTFNVQ